MDCCEPEQNTPHHSSVEGQPKKERWHVLLALVPIAAALGVAVVVLRAPGTNGSAGTDTASAITAQSTGTDEVSDSGQGSVTVSARLERDRISDDELVFTLALNTHSVDLSSFDPLTQVRLKATGGTAYEPRLIEDPGQQQSHHQSFRIGFIRPKGEKVVLVVQNVGGVAERDLPFTL